MNWWRKRTEQLEREQAEADRAVVTARVDYMAMLDMKRLAQNISERHLRLQKENHFGYRIFGVDVDGNT